MDGAMHWEESVRVGGQKYVSSFGGLLGGGLGGLGGQSNALGGECESGRTELCGSAEALRLPTVAANGPVRPHRQKQHQSS